MARTDGTKCPKCGDLITILGGYTYTVGNTTYENLERRLCLRCHDRRLRWLNLIAFTFIVGVVLAWFVGHFVESYFYWSLGVTP